jgi:hypothetical protein
MHQPFSEVERCDVTVGFRVRKCLVNVEKLDTFGFVIALHCLQTGDIF